MFLRKKELILSNTRIGKDYLIFFIFYTVSFSLLLLNFDGLYWDDWVILNQTIETKQIFFSEFKNDVLYYFHMYFSSLNNSAFWYRVFVFVSYFLTGIFLNAILKNIKELSSKDIFYITLLYLIMPVISSRISISIIPFFFPLLMFYASFYLLTKYLKNNSYILRFIILVGFYISFYTNSILVFYALVLIYIYYIKYGLLISLNNIKKFSIRYVDFIALPIIFFIIKVIYYKPTGLYAGYNSVGDTSIFKIIFNLFKSFDTSLFNVIHQALYVSLPFWLVIIIILFVYKKYKFKKEKLSLNDNSKYLLFFGVLIFLLAVFPYISVSKLPKVDNFSSRFQLLTPLGLAFIFYFGINLITKYFKFSLFLRQSLLFILIFSFIGKNISDYYKWQIDSLYMTSVMMNFKDNGKVKDNSTFILNNNIVDKLIYGREPPFYEWNGMMKKAFLSENKLVISFKQYKDIESIIDQQKYIEYNFVNWVQGDIILLNITYNYMQKRNSNTRISKLFYLKFMDYNRYLEEVEKLTYVSTSSFLMDN